ISAGHFFFDRGADLITYTRDVHVDESQMNLACEEMNIQRSTNRSIDTIVADRNVVIIAKATEGRATGDHAVYSAVGGQQLVTLTGNPRYQDRLREGTGKVFIFDRSDPQRSILRIQDDAHLRLSRQSVNESGGLLSSPAAQTATSGTNAGFIDIT